jgi:hypothetical protein
MSISFPQSARDQCPLRLRRLFSVDALWKAKKLWRSKAHWLPRPEAKSASAFG